MRNRRASSAVALVTALHHEKSSPHLSRLSSAFASPGLLQTSLEPSCHPSSMHHRVRLRATPIVEDQNQNVPVDEEQEFKATRIQFPRNSSSIEVTNGNQEEEDILDTRKGPEAALAVLLLNVVAILWGTQHAVIKMVVDDSSAAPFTLLRFGLAALIAAPYTPGVFNNKPKGGNSSGWNHTEQTITAWRWGAEMGFWMFLGFSCQALGLETTTAQRSGFLLYLNVKFVPFFSRFLWGRPISIPTWVSALVAFGGTALLATDGESTIGFNVGDLWSIAAAAASAMYILRLEKAVAMVQDAARLNSACLWVVASLAAIWTFGGGGGGGGRVVDISETLAILGTTAQSYPWQILYLGAVTTTLANYIQSRGQRYISPERASILYSLDPVYGAFFSWFLLGETIGGVQALVGAGMITVAAGTNAFLDFGTKKDEDVPSSSGGSSSSSTSLME